MKLHLQDGARGTMGLGGESNLIERCPECMIALNDPS